mmetsp:Transcript_57979/g.172465  ORF Transcript_57979/g.172465 Transcript_57979/m.172465 type:complete len:229 (+) Transcript_57979:236-922(+)
MEGAKPRIAALAPCHKLNAATSSCRLRRRAKNLSISRPRAEAAVAEEPEPEPEEEEEGDRASRPGAALESDGGIGASGSGVNWYDHSRSAGTYEPGDAVEYFNTRHHFWSPARVCDVDSCRSIALDVKPGVWLSAELQGSLVRPSPFSTRPGQNRLPALERDAHLAGVRGADQAEQRALASLGQGVGCRDGEGRWWAAPPRWVERYQDQRSPEMQVSPRAHKVSRRPP